MKTPSNTTHTAKTKGFTLIEMLVSITILGILSSLLLPTLSSAKERAHRNNCRNNLRQLMIASLLYAGDHPHGDLSGATSPSDGNLNWLYPHYSDSLKIFLCPSTRNFIRPNIIAAPIDSQIGLMDLHFPAGHRLVQTGTSYQLYGYFGHTKNLAEKKTQRNLSTYTSPQHPGQPNPGPSAIWLLADQTRNGLIDTADELDNHRNSGINIAYCDGHVEWLSNPEIPASYKLSQFDSPPR